MDIFDRYRASQSSGSGGSFYDSLQAAKARFQQDQERERQRKIRAQKGKKINVMGVDYTNTGKGTWHSSVGKGKTLSQQQIDQLRGIDKAYDDFAQEGKDRATLTPGNVGRELWTATQKVGNVLGEVNKTVANAPYELGIKYPGEAIAGYIWGQSQSNEARGQAQTQLGNEALTRYADTQYTNMRKSEIDRAQKAGEITRQRADELRKELQSNIDKATQAVKGITEQSKTKYGQDIPTTSELTLSAADAASGLAIGGVGSVKAVSSGVAKKIYTTLVKDAEKTLGRKVTQAEAQNIATRADNLAKSVTEANKQKPSSFAPLDEQTTQKMTELVQTSNATPVEDGFTRLYQTNDSLAQKSDQFFQDTTKLANYINGRADNANLKFVDVPNDAVKTVPGKPGVFKVADTTPKVAGTSQKLISEVARKSGEELNGGATFNSLEGQFNQLAADAVKLADEDPQTALGIATGRIATGSDAEAVIVKNALIEKSLSQGDHLTLQQLANSPINTRVSESAQTLAAEGASSTLKADPVKNMQSVVQARIKGVTSRSRKSQQELVNSTAAKIQKSVPKVSKNDWASFVSKLECK